MLQDLFDDDFQCTEIIADTKSPLEVAMISQKADCGRADLIIERPTL